MEIWMTSSTCDSAHACVFELARQTIEPAFNRRFDRADYGSGLVELQYRALLHATGRPAYGEVKKYFRALHAVQVNAKVEIPENFTTAEVVARVAISVARTIERLRRTRIPDFDLDRFAHDYALFAVEQAWLDKPIGGPPKLYVVPRPGAADRAWTLR